MHLRPAYHQQPGRPPVDRSWGRACALALAEMGHFEQAAEPVFGRAVQKPEELDHADRLCGAEEVLTTGRLHEKQEVLNVVPRLDVERRHPPSPRTARELAAHEP